MKVLDLTKYRNNKDHTKWLKMLHLQYPSGKMSGGKYMKLYHDKFSSGNILSQLKVNDSITMIVPYLINNFRKNEKLYNLYLNGKVEEIVEKGVKLKFEKIISDLTKQEIILKTRKYKLQYLNEL